MNPHLRQLLLSDPSWIMPGAALDFDFQNSRYFNRGKTNSVGTIAVVRASNATDLVPLSASGFAYTVFGSATAAISPGIGLYVFTSRTNNLLNSAVPVTQTTASLGTGTYTLWVNGSGSATSSAGSATGSSFGAATNGTPNVFTLSVAGTVVVTVAGSLNAFQLEAGAYGTSFIITTGVTATRAADTLSVLMNAMGTDFTQFAQVNPMSPTNNAANQVMMQMSAAGASANRVFLQRSSSTGRGVIFVTGGGNNYSKILVPVLALGARGKLIGGVTSTAMRGTVGAAAVETAAIGTPMAASINTLHIGNASSTTQLDGLIERVVVWPFMLPDADLQRITA